MIIAQLSKRDSHAGIMYMTICRQAPDLPMSEVLEHLNELCLYGLIHRGAGGIKVAREDFMRPLLWFTRAMIQPIIVM